jgi:hypothetical protein
MLLSCVIVKASYKRTKHTLILAALLVIPAVLLFLPSDYFDSGESICLSKIILDKECLGCGMTRGVMHTIHFEFKEAWGFNKLTFFLLPILIYYWFKWLLNSVKIIRSYQEHHN